MSLLSQLANAAGPIWKLTTPFTRIKEEPLSPLENAVVETQLAAAMYEESTRTMHVLDQSRDSKRYLKDLRTVLEESMRIAVLLDRLGGRTERAPPAPPPASEDGSRAVEAAIESYRRVSSAADANAVRPPRFKALSLDDDGCEMPPSTSTMRPPLPPPPPAGEGGGVLSVKSPGDGLVREMLGPKPLKIRACFTIGAAPEGDDAPHDDDDPIAPKLSAQLRLYREKLSAAYAPGVRQSAPEPPTRSAFYMRTLERHAAQLAEARARLAGLQPQPGAAWELSPNKAAAAAARAQLFGRRPSTDSLSSLSSVASRSTRVSSQYAEQADGEWLQCHVQVCMQLLKLFDVDLAFLGWCRLRVCVHAEAATMRTGLGRVASHFLRAPWTDADGAFTALDELTSNLPQVGHVEYVSRWIATPLMSMRELLRDVAIFQVPLPPVRLREGLEPKDLWPTSAPIRIHIALEGSPDPHAALTQLYHLRRSVRREGNESGEFSTFTTKLNAQDLKEYEACIGVQPGTIDAIPPLGPANEGDIREIASSSVTVGREDQPSAALAFVEAVLHDRHDGMAALQCLVHMAPLHANVFDASSPPIPGAGYEIDHTESARRLFSAPQPHPLWTDDPGREACIKHAEVLRDALVVGSAAVHQVLTNTLEQLHAEHPSLLLTAWAQQAPGVEAHKLDIPTPPPYQESSGPNATATEHVEDYTKFLARFHSKVEALLDLSSALHLANLAWVTLGHALTSCKLGALVREMRKRQHNFELNAIASCVVRERFPFSERLTQHSAQCAQQRAKQSRELSQKSHSPSFDAPTEHEAAVEVLPREIWPSLDGTPAFASIARKVVQVPVEQVQGQPYPTLFEDIFEPLLDGPSPPEPPPPEHICSHLVVLIHGFCGSAYDMRLLCSFLQLKMPNVAFLISKSNEQLVNCTIDEMAERLTYELTSFMNANEDQLQIHRLSFIAFSIGGCVLRAALRKPALRKYLPFLHTLITISSPLLGLLVPHSSSFIKGGLWFLTNVTGDPALKELCFTDKEKAITDEDGYLCWLNAPGMMPTFKNVILFGSPHDKFIPLYSSHLRPPPDMSHDDPRYRMLLTMSRNTLDCLRSSTFIRVEVHFNHAKKFFNMDEALGRATHVVFLESIPFMRMLANRYAPYFMD